MEENTIYTFRPLKASDSFLMFKLISKIGVNEFAACFEKDGIKKVIEKAQKTGKLENINTVVGISVTLEIANVVIGNLPKAEGEIFQLLADTSNLTAEEVKDLPLATFAEMVINFVKKDEFRDFVEVVLKSFKKEN